MRNAARITAQAEILPEPPLPCLRFMRGRLGADYFKLQLFQALLEITDTMVFWAVLPLPHD